MSMHSVCCRKVRHRTEKDARKALAATVAETPVCLPIRKLIVYKCVYCPYWHLGHDVPSIPKPKAVLVSGRIEP